MNKLIDIINTTITLHVHTKANQMNIVYTNEITYPQFLLKEKICNADPIRLQAFLSY